MYRNYFYSANVICKKMCIPVLFVDICICTCGTAVVLYW